jgi:hypothetical protein
LQLQRQARDVDRGSTRLSESIVHREGNRRFVDWVVQPDSSAAPAQSATAHGDTPGSPADGGSGDLIGLSEPTTGALALGKAFHGTLARNFRQKLKTDHDMVTRELSEVFSAEWSLASADAALRDDEDADELTAAGQILGLRLPGRSCYSFATAGNRTDRARQDCRRQSARDRRSAGH